MHRFEIVFGTLITIGCMLGPASASAKAGDTRPRVLVTLFGEPGGAPSEPPSPESHLTPELEREFAALDGEVGTNRVDAATGYGQFLHIPAQRVPAWMRTGRRPAALPVGPGMFLTPSAASCTGRAYMPSSLLGREAEELRRLLYPLVQSAACEVGLPVGLMDAMLIQESRYNPLAISPKGAVGLGQLMPGTAVQLGVDRYNLRGNLEGAARYLRQHVDEFGQVPLALAAYNAGPGRVRKAWSIPRIRETQKYVAQILTNWRAIEMGARSREDRRLASSAKQTTIISRFP